MNKQEAESIINSLADKTLSFGCEVIRVDLKQFFSPDEEKDIPIEQCRWDKEEEYTCTIDNSFIVSEKGLPSCIHWFLPKDATVIIKILGHPILIGDVLEKMYLQRKDSDEAIEKLLDTWVLCCDREKEETGFTRSFQEIVESGWEECNKEQEIKCGCLGNDKTCFTCDGTGNYMKGGGYKVLKPEVVALAQFIISLGL